MMQRHSDSKPEMDRFNNTDAKAFLKHPLVVTVAVAYIVMLWRSF